MQWLARIGYLAKGVIYATVGVLAAAAVFGWFGVNDAAGTRRAIEAIADQPFGNFLLIALVAGLVGFIVWRFVQGIADTENKGSDVNGWIHRIGFMISGAMYSALAWYTVSLIGWFSTSAAETSQRRQLLDDMMSSESGILAVGLIGAGIVLSGLYQGYSSVAKSFRQNWHTSELSLSQERYATRLAQFGIGVRAVTFIIIGGLVIQAAVDADPAEPTGLGEALRTLGEQPFGQFLLAVSAFGLMCYGVYCFVESRYRAISI